MNKYPIYIFTVFIVALFLTPVDGLAQQSRTITLGGYHSVPRVNTAASATVTITLKNDSLSVSGSFSDLSNYYYGAAIFYGKKGERGNQMFRLDADVAEDHISGSFDASKNTFTPNKPQLQELAKGNLYISIYSYDHKFGEIRAQIPPIK